MRHGIDNSPQDGRGLHIAVVATHWNAFVVEPMLAGALAALQQCGAKATVYRVPGAFELPLAAQWACDNSRASCVAVIALGAVIRGDTPHFDFVAGECARGLAKVALKMNKPVIFGVLTTNTADQAVLRADPNGDNKGAEAAHAAVAMANLRRALTQGSADDV